MRFDDRSEKRHRLTAGILTAVLAGGLSLATTEVAAATNPAQWSFATGYGYGGQGQLVDANTRAPLSCTMDNMDRMATVGIGTGDKWVMILHVSLNPGDSLANGDSYSYGDSFSYGDLKMCGEAHWEEGGTPLGQACRATGLGKLVLNDGRTIFVNDIVLYDPEPGVWGGAYVSGHYTDSMGGTGAITGAYRGTTTWPLCENMYQYPVATLLWHPAA